MKRDKNSPAQSDRKGEGNLYDKIFKETAEKIFMPLVEGTLGIKIKWYKPWKEKLQTTLEREYDFFYEVETETGEQFLLHIEYQTDNDLEMVYRKAEYHGIALRKKKMRIRHLVIYLGESKLTMPTKLPEDQVYQGFELIDVHSLQPEILLSSQIPEMVMWAILSDYPKERAEEILQAVLKRLHELSSSTALKSRYLKQLIILSRLRKLEGLTTENVSDMPVTYDITTDYLYNEGMQQGMQQEKAVLIPKLFSEKKWDAQEIASFLNVSIQKVKEVLKQSGLL